MGAVYGSYSNIHTMVSDKVGMKLSISLIVSYNALDSNFGISFFFFFSFNYAASTSNTGSRCFTFNMASPTPGVKSLTVGAADDATLENLGYQQGMIWSH